MAVRVAVRVAVPVAVGIAGSVRATVFLAVLLRGAGDRRPMLACERADAVADAVLAIGQLRLAAVYLLLYLPAPVGGIQAPCRGSPRDSDSRRGYSNAGEQLDRKRRAGSSEKRPRGLAARGRAPVGDRHGRERVQDPVQLLLQLALEIAHW